MAPKRTEREDTPSQESKVKSNKRAKVKKVKPVFAPTHKFTSKESTKNKPGEANKKKPIVQTPKNPEKEEQKLQESIDYLTCFALQKQLWKFRKNTQIYIFQNAFSEKYSDKVFDHLVLYLKDCKGNSRETLLTKAKEIFDSEDVKSDTPSESSDAEKEEEDQDVEKLSPEALKLQKKRAAKILAVLA